MLTSVFGILSSEARATAAPPLIPLFVSQSGNHSAARELKELFTLGRKQSRNGQYPQALQHFLKLWDLNPDKAGPIRGIRTSILLGEIARVAEVYPPALEAMRQRVEILQRKWRSKADRRSLSDLFAIGATFKSEVDTLVLYDQIESDSPMKTEFSFYALDGLLEAKRYTDIVAFHRPLVQLERALIVSRRQEAQMKNDPRAPQLKKRSRQFLRAKAAKEIQALLGAQEFESAHEYAEKYLAFDSSEESRTAIENAAVAVDETGFFNGK